MFHCLLQQLPRNIPARDSHCLRTTWANRNTEFPLKKQNKKKPLPTALHTLEGTSGFTLILFY